MDKQNKSECNFYSAIFIKNEFQRERGGRAWQGMFLQIVHFALKMLSLKAQQLAKIFDMQNGKRRRKAKAKGKESYTTCPAQRKLKRLKWNLLDLYTFNLHS